MKHEIKDLVYIGFGCQKHFKPTVWKYAKEMMELAVKNGLARPFNFGRGKGKYATDLKMIEIVDGLAKIPEAHEIAERFAAYKYRCRKQLDEAIQERKKDAAQEALDILWKSQSMSFGYAAHVQEQINRMEA